MKHTLRLTHKGLGNPMVATQVADIAAKNPQETVQLIKEAGGTGRAIVTGYFDTWKTIAKVGGTVIGGGALAIGLFVVIQKLSKPKGGKSDKTGYEDEVDKKEPLSHSLAQFKIFAKRLQEAFHGFGTDEDTVLEVIREMKSKNDFYKLVDIYGIRDIIADFQDKKEGTLIDHLISDLVNNKPELKLIKDHLSQFNIYL